jgi:hypothetical protein
MPSDPNQSALVSGTYVEMASTVVVISTVSYHMTYVLFILWLVTDDEVCEIIMHGDFVSY